MSRKILTPEQVADLLQVHPLTILKYIRKGNIKASKLGRVYRIREEEIDNFLERMEV